MLNLLVKPLLGIAGDVVSGVIEAKKAKAKQKLVKIEAETELLEKQIKGEIDWDVEAIKGSKESWKDEYLTISFGIKGASKFFKK